MIRSQALPQPERVADWPRLTAAVRPDGTGSLTINGTEHACQALSVEELRTGIIAHCAAIAARLGRPVRLAVTEDTSTWVLGIRPQGIVQLVDEQGMIPAADTLGVHEGRCRKCRRLQSVTVASCGQCGITDPHRITVDPPSTEFDDSK